MLKQLRASAFLAGLLCSVVLATSAVAQSASYHFDIPGKALAEALRDYGQISGLDIIFTEDLVRGFSTTGLLGEFTAEEALQHLLQGTGLIAERSAAGALMIRREREDARVAEENSRNDDEEVQTARLSQRNNPGDAVVEEILVTAQKKEERLVETPLSVSVLSAKQLEQMGATQLRDFADIVPGMSYTTSGAGNSQVSLRGVTAGADVAATTAMYVDDVPFGSATAFALGAQFGPDIALFDLERIEVLRGPQGTLYGGGAMGGLIKYVTTAPDPSHFSSGARVGVSSTANGGTNYNGAVGINFPISPEVAGLRASAFESHDGGFIDNAALNDSDVNESDIYGGRLDLLLTPTSAFSVRLTAFSQVIDREGESSADYDFSGSQPYGVLGQYRPFDEPFDQSFEVYSGTVTYDFPAATFTSITAYQSISTEFFWDVSSIYAPLLNSFGFGPYSAVGVPSEAATDKFTQELRLVSDGGETFDWVLGAFYTNEDSDLREEFVLRDLAGEPLPNDVFTYFSPSTYEEVAIFGDVTLYLTDRFDVTAGMRYAKNEITNSTEASGVLGVSKPETKFEDEVLTYLAHARYRFDDDVFGYFRYATGYRPGGPNFATIDPGTGEPVGQSSFESDELASYEIGLKSQIANNSFGLDVAAFFIDWSNIQISVNSGGFSGIENAPGGATIRGLEVSLSTRPTDGLSLASALTYQDGELTEDDARLGGVKGERLPISPHFTATLMADYELPYGQYQPTLGATMRYVSDRTGSFDASPSFPQYELPDYFTLNLRAGLMFGELEAQVYVHNVLNEHGQLSLMWPQFGGRVAIQQPRTAGLNLTMSF